MMIEKKEIENSELYKFDVFAESEEEAVKRARELTGDKFVSIQSKSIGDKLKLIYK